LAGEDAVPRAAATIRLPSRHTQVDGGEGWKDLFLRELGYSSADVTSTGTDLPGGLLYEPRNSQIV